MDSPNKRYLIGSSKKLGELFPQYNGNDVRKSLDGKLAIYEVNLTSEELKKLKSDKGVKIFTHEEILSEINSPKSDGIWYQSGKSEPAVDGE